MPDGTATPAIIASAGDLLQRYDVVLCDIWGVLHNGVREHEKAGSALETYRRAGGIVVLLSNSPAPSETVAHILAGKAVRSTAYDAIVSSGDLTRQRMKALGIERVHHLGPARDLSLFDGQEIDLVDVEAAEIVVATGLIDDMRETAEDYRDWLVGPARQGLPLICANPDRIVEVGDLLLQCAGAIGDVYEELGGSVYWEGKPHAQAYQAAIACAEQLAGRVFDRRGILAIGDSIVTDMRGAAGAGLDALFIGHGIHRAEAMAGDRLDPDRLGALLSSNGCAPVAAMAGLAW